MTHADGTLKPHSMTPGDYVEESKRLDAPSAAILADLVTRMGRAGSAIAREVRRAALAGHLGYSGGENVTGDRQKKLDLIGNDIVLEEFTRSENVAAIISEEDDLPVPTKTPNAPYVLCTDPIDGSSNTDVDGPMGTIFSFCRRPASGGFPQGKDIAVAGYVLYGPGTIFALSAGDGATAFTLDLDSGAWAQTHPALRCPGRGKTFSGNLGRQREWHPHVRRWLDWMTETDKETSRPYSLRYIGALVADLHRCLVEGGVYFYPGDPKNQDGKLRLLYECAPLAFLTEQAGGRASTGTRRVLDVEAIAAHQRTQFVVGSVDDVIRYETFLAKGGTA